MIDLSANKAFQSFLDLKIASMGRKNGSVDGASPRMKSYTGPREGICYGNRAKS